MWTYTTRTTQKFIRIKLTWILRTHHSLTVNSRLAKTFITIETINLIANRQRLRRTEIFFFKMEWVWDQQLFIQTIFQVIFLMFPIKSNNLTYEQKTLYRSNTPTTQVIISQKTIITFKKMSNFTIKELINNKLMDKIINQWIQKICRKLRLWPLIQIIIHLCFNHPSTTDNKARR